MINTGKPFRLKVTPGFFQGLTDDGFDQTFISLDMTSRLVIYGLSVVDFFDHEKPAVLFDHGGHGDVQEGIGGSRIQGKLRFG